MNRLFTFIWALLSPCLVLWAQEADIRRMAEAYADVQTLSAKVTRTSHNPALAEDVVTKGAFYLKKPGKMCLAFDNNKDMLLMEDDTFTLVQGGRRTVAKGRNGQVMSALGTVLRALFADGTYRPDTEAVDVKAERQGSRCTLTLTPRLASAKEKRRLLFHSFQLTIDTGTSRLLSLRMEGRGGSYTQYDLSDYQRVSSLPDAVFTPVAP